MLLTAASASSRSRHGSGRAGRQSASASLSKRPCVTLITLQPWLSASYVLGCLARLPRFTTSPATGPMAEPTPLEQVHALRKAIESSIELMNPGGSNGRATGPEAIQYHILNKQYVLRKPTRHIMTRYSIAESTYHRYRRDAVSVLASHLEAQEEQLRREIA